MNKKLAVFIVAVIVIAVVLFFFINKDKGERIIDTDKMADDIGQYVDKDKNEIKDILEQEITDEQRDTRTIAKRWLIISQITRFNYI